MMAMSKSRIVRVALGLFALAGVAAAVPAAAQDFNGHGWGHDRVIVERGLAPRWDAGFGPRWHQGYAPRWYGGYAPAWRPAPFFMWHHHDRAW